LLAVVLLVVASGIEGCANCNYGAHASLFASNAETPPDFPSLPDVLDEALHPLGFIAGHNAKLPDYYYEIGVGFHLGGNRVSVSWDPQSGLITIYDFKNFDASEFDRMVQKTIQDELERRYGLKLSFTRNPSKSSSCLFGP
jgi:hypothetical protein